MRQLKLERYLDQENGGQLKELEGQVNMYDERFKDMQVEFAEKQEAESLLKSVYDSTPQTSFTTLSGVRYLLTSLL